MKNYPKIGIRPTIDGRQGGIREGLEEKTMCLAKAVSELISANLKNPDGTPVECVIADTTIGRVAEAAACAEKFEKCGVGSTITVTSCWCYGSETMDMNPHWPKAVWGFNGTERPGAVYLAAVLAGHAQKGLPAFGIYGHDVQDLVDNTIPEDVAEKILRWARSAQAVALMRGKSYLQIGSICMGIGGSIIDTAFIEEYLGQLGMCRHKNVLTTTALAVKLDSVGHVFQCVLICTDNVLIYLLTEELRLILRVEQMHLTSDLRIYLLTGKYLYAENVSSLLGKSVYCHLIILICQKVRDYNRISVAPSDRGRNDSLTYARIRVKLKLVKLVDTAKIRVLAHHTRNDPLERTTTYSVYRHLIHF